MAAATLTIDEVCASSSPELITIIVLVALRLTPTPQIEPHDGEWAFRLYSPISENIANCAQPSNLPNLRRLFVEARTDAEESEYSRNAVCSPILLYSSSTLTKFRTVLQPCHVHVLDSWLQLGRSAHDV